MKLFLGGGGSGIDSIELDKKFVDVLDLTRPLLYIPIAADTIKYPYPSCVNWLSKTLGSFGVKNIIMWTENELAGKSEEDFEQFAGVYIGGGNTFKLLKELKEFGTFEILRKLAQKDIPIYGGSAGAIILAKTIIPAMSGDENDIGLTDFSALNLTHDFDIWCHYVDTEDPLIQEYMTKYKLEKVIAIPETAGLFVTNRDIEVIGPYPVRIFKDGKNSVVYPESMVV